jgi:predicted glutamine amidotransferase
MCRLLLVQSKKSFEINPHLEKFATISKNSREYQGHGWGCSYLQNGEWVHYKNIQPVWEDDLDSFPQTTLLLAHARSAFQDEGIVIENNMPFYDGQYVFIFNGELHGVRIQSEGRIGAEKIFNTIRRFDRGDMFSALKKGAMVINKRSRYVKAMNLILADKKKVYVATQFSEDPDYFTMFIKRSETSLMICSEPYPGETDWEKIQNHTIEGFEI